MSSDESDHESLPDAELVVKKTRHGSIVAWSWTDDRKTVTPTEHEELVDMIKTAETRFAPENMDGGTVIADVWMDDDETIRTVRWTDE
jgi:hypothetical protein